MKVLYVTFLVLAAGEEARNKGVVADKIYRPQKSGCISVYTLENGNLIKFNSCTTSNIRKLSFWVEPRDAVFADDTQILGKIHNFKKGEHFLKLHYT